jgi:hypothetical protein
MESLDKLEQWLSAFFMRLAGTAGGAHPAELAEVRRAILREIAARIESKGRGEYFFRYTMVGVELFVPDAERRDAFDVAFGGGALEQDVREMLAERGCADEPVVSVTVSENAESSAGDRPWHIQWSRESGVAKVRAARPPAYLKVLQGIAAEPKVTIERDRVHLGRIKDVVDSKTGLVRRNDVAFDASETTVARRHASIQYDAISGRFRVLSDPSNQAPTTVFRNGAAIRCDSTRGVELRSGDEIHLGNARVLFEIVGAGA